MDEKNLVNNEPMYEDALDENYWQMLLAQAEAETAEYVEDAIAIQDSVADSVRFAEDASKDFDEIAGDIFKSLDQLNEKLDDKNIDELEKLTNILETGQPVGANAHGLTEEQIQGLLDALEYTKDWKPNSDLDSILKNTQEKYPVRYAASQIKGHVNDAAAELRKAVDEVASVKQYYALALDGYRKSLSAIGNMALMNAQSGLSEIKSSALETLRSGLEMSAKALNFAASEFTRICDKAKTFLQEKVRALSKFVDKSLDMVTLGAYSKIARAVEKFNEKNPENKFAKALTDMNCAFRGTDSETYWKDVSDNAFLWGNMKDEAGQVIGYEASPVQGLANGVKSLESKFFNFADRAEAKIKEIGTEIAASLEKFELNMEAECLGFKAEMAERLSSMYEKQGRRVQSKIEKLEKTDKEIFEIQTQLRSTLHKLTSVTPFIREEYKPDENTLNTLAILQSAQPTKEVEFAKEMITREVAKEKKKFDRAQNRAEALNSVKNTAKNIAAGVVGLVDEKVLDKRAECITKLVDAQIKLESISKKEAAFSKVAEQSLAKANDLLEQANKENDGFER